MTSDTWTPSGDLAIAILHALQDLARHWPKAMALAFESTEAGRAYHGDYAFACRDADHRAITMAARQWIAREPMPPKPAALGQLANEITKAHFPRELPPPEPLPPIEHVHDEARLVSLHERATRELQSAVRVMQVWEWLRVHASSSEDRDAIRHGVVTDERFDEAVAAIKHQQREAA